MAQPQTKTSKKRLFIDEIRRNQHILDKDGDGELSLEEVAALGRQLGLTAEETEEFFDELDVDGDGGLSMKELRRSSVGSFLFFNFILAPMVMFVVCLVLGWLLALMEGWDPLDGFYFVACDITGLEPFFMLDDDEELSAFGEAAEIAISVIALTLSSGFIGISCLMSLASDLPHWLGIINSPLRGLAAMLLLLPGAILAFCFVLGAVFAAIEGWSTRQGFEYLIQMVCGIGDPITEVQPDSDRTRIIALAIAIASLGITTVIVGLIGAMVACKDLVFFIEVKLAKVESGMWALCALAMGRPPKPAKAKNKKKRSSFTVQALDAMAAKTGGTGAPAGGDVEMGSSSSSSSGVGGSEKRKSAEAKKGTDGAGASSAGTPKPSRLSSSPPQSKSPKGKASKEPSSSSSSSSSLKDKVGGRSPGGALEDVRSEKGSAFADEDGTRL